MFFPPRAHPQNPAGNPAVSFAGDHRLKAGLAFCLLLLLGIGLSPLALAQDAKDSQYDTNESALLPGHPQTLIAGWHLEQFAGPNSAEAASEIVAVAGQPFSRAMRVTVKQAVVPEWRVQIITPKNLKPIQKGDTIFVVYQVRCLKSSAESGGGHIAGYLQLAHDPWEAFGGFKAAPGANWFKGYASAVAPRDYAAGEFELTFHLGQSAQTVEMGGLMVVNLGQNVAAAQLPVSRITYAGREPEAPWRKAAEARIEKFRKGDLTVKVTDARGQPLAGLPVRVKMTRHAYQFGTFLEDPTAWLNQDGQNYRAYVEKWFNRVTVPVYWADWGWPGAKLPYLERAAWAQEHGFQVRGHNLVWPSWQWMPKAIRQYETNPAQLRQVVRDHIADICTNFSRFGFEDYDVVNEPRDNHAVMDLCGQAVMLDWFKLARELDPKPKLGINENTIISGGGWATAQQDNYEQWIKYLLKNKAPLGVLGFQCHFGEELTPPARVLEILDRFAKYKLPLQATEFDVNCADEEAQADYLRDFFTVFFSHPQTEALTMWGFWEKVQWIPRAALIRTDWTLKPNGHMFQELVYGKWWTDVTQPTGADGTLTVRGFLGDYEILVGESMAKVKLMPAGTSIHLHR